MNTISVENSRKRYTTMIKTPLSVVVVVSQRDLDNNLSDPALVNSEKCNFIIGLRFETLFLFTWGRS